MIPKVINNDSLVFRPEFIKPLTAFDQFRVFKGPMRQHPGPLVLCVSIQGRWYNLSSHKGPRVREMIEAAGADLRYLPPYSPDFRAFSDQVVAG